MRNDANVRGVEKQAAKEGSHPKLDRRNILLAGTTLAAASAIASSSRAQVAQGQPQPSVSSGSKPNILVIFGDDIGIPQISAYSMGIMGYRTPNVDRIAREGAIFTDSYGQQSCTAGRASFILGQEPFRTGLLTIGMPGDPHGITGLDADYRGRSENPRLRHGPIRQKSSRRS
jgi:arylsulfatase